MRRDKIDQDTDLSGRIRSLEQFTGTLVSRDEPAIEVIPIHDEPVARVPAPRRSRIFLRSGEGHGVFAELTLTAPSPRLASD